MKAMLERYAARLTPLEQEWVWEGVSGSLAGTPRPILGWTLVASSAMAVVGAVFIFSVLQRAVVAPVGKPQSGAVHVIPQVVPRTEVKTQPPESVPHAEPSPAAEDIAKLPVESLARAADVWQPFDNPKALGRSPMVPGNLGVLVGRVTDSRGHPVPFANVVLIGTKLGAIAEEDGTYRIEGVPPATYTLGVQSLGFERKNREFIVVEQGMTTAADIQVQEVVVAMSEVLVTGPKSVQEHSPSAPQSITSEKLNELPVDQLSEAVRNKAGVVAKGDELYFHGGRVPVIPITGGTSLPNDEAFDSMFFKSYGVHPFITTTEDALSTFAVDVDAGSYTVMRRYLELGHLPPPEAVRVEEFVNFFPQGYPQFHNQDFRILIDGAPSPFGSGYHLVRIGIKGREVVERERKPAQLTFVIDVSGSMKREDRLELVKQALNLLVDQLRHDDEVGLVVYGSRGQVLLEPADGSERERFLDAISRLRPEGSTNAEEGLRLGYDMARRHYRSNAINRIILCADGVANVGRTGPESILKEVRSESERGIHLTTIGFGMGNYNDVLMEQLADRGDGSYYYVDNLDEARRVFVENLTGTLQTIAKDAKVQVEFDSTRVLRYRLLGFENRDVADQDFRNDQVDAGEIGAGHEVTALYEVKLAPRVGRGTLATVRFRYARPEDEDGPQVHEIEKRYDSSMLARRFENAAPEFRLDAAVAEFAEILRGSYWAKGSKLSDVLAVARKAAGNLRSAVATEFVTLVEKSAALDQRSKTEE
jgi:Ca-activated chloride channel homolog